ncbi:MAG: T9SS type A sorting domain-containing protein [Bacteroidales bacterium]|nr:T9SS type A sorting domain-containing protein [Bacteroidales bacterium]
MKKTILLTAICCLISLGVKAQQCEVVQRNLAEVQLHYTTGKLSATEVTLLSTNYSQLNMTGYGHRSEVGQPALPTLVKLVEMSLGQGVTTTVEAMVCDTLDGEEMGIFHSVLPAQPSRSKSDVSPLVLYKNATTYATNAFYALPLAEVETIGVARNQNLVRVLFNPVQWNPVTNQVVVVREATITLTVNQPDVAATQTMRKLHASGAFSNGVEILNMPKDNYTTAPLRYTIIAHSSFRGMLDDFVVWKKRQGFIVDEKYTDDSEVGSTKESIQTYLKSLYDNATTSVPAPTYVLFVGDVAQVPAFYVSSNNENHYSDLPYVCWTTGDNIPDAYYGRFSAQTADQLTSQICKTLMYEQYTFPDDSYLSVAALIAGEDGGYESDNAYKYCDPAMDYTAKEYVNSAHGFNTVAYYKNNTSFAPTGVTVTGSSQTSATATALRNLYNSGCGWANYSAHGDVDSWSTPSFTTSHVSQMTNNDKPMVMIGNCCLSSSFQQNECFGEALLRKGNNAGAVGYIGASNYTYWTEDFYWQVGVRNNVSNTCNPTYNASNLGMYDRLFHTHNESYTNQYLTLGGMIRAGNMAVESSTSTLKTYYWQVYHVMGDPSLMPWLGTAATMAASVPDMAYTQQGLNITAVPYAYIGVTNTNQELIGAAFANSNGTAHIDLPTNMFGTIDVVITAQGYRPYTKTITVISRQRPYATVLTPSAPLVAGTNVNFDLTIQNYGSESYNNMTVELQTVAGDLLLATSGQIAVEGTMTPLGTMTLNNINSAYVWDNVADNRTTEINVIVRWGTWENDKTIQTFNFQLQAPNVHATTSTTSSALTSNSTTVLTVDNVNSGHAALTNATAELTSLHPSITVSSPVSINNLATDATDHTQYTLTCTGNLGEYGTLPFIQVISNGSHRFVDTIYVNYGTRTADIDFEDNAWGDYSWTHGDYPWEITTTGVYAGTYCARSKTWSTSYWGSQNGNNCTSDLTLTWTSAIGDSISFYKNVSSENNYDFYYFYIDGNEMESMSGTNNNWSRSSYYVPAGTHTFKWSYAKDASQRSGSDCAWIDNIKLPGVSTQETFLLDSVCQGSEYTFAGQTINTSTTGRFQYTDNSNANALTYLTLVVNATPTITINTSTSTIKAGEHARLTVQGENYNDLLWNTGAKVPTIDVYPTETTTYTVTGYNGNCSSNASTTIVVNGTIGIDEATHYELILYPNPAQHSVTIEGEALQQVRVLNLLGQALATESIDGQQSRTTLDVSKLTNGIYLIEVTHTNGDRSVRKLIKK